MTEKLFILSDDYLKAMDALQDGNVETGKSAVMFKDKAGKLGLAFEYVVIQMVKKPDVVLHHNLNIVAPRPYSAIISKLGIGTSVTVGKGKTIWVVAGYENNDYVLSRDGKGRTRRVASPMTVKQVVK